MCSVVQPPFNTEARAEAGFGEHWYLPLATMQPQSKPQQPMAAAAQSARPSSQHLSPAAGCVSQPVPAMHAREQLVPM